MRRLHRHHRVRTDARALVRGSSLFLAAILLLFLLFSSTPPTSADTTSMPRLFISTSFADVNEQVLITLVDAANTSDYRVVVQHDSARAVYNGAITTTLVYTPTEEGVYIFSLERKSSGTVIDTTVLTVLDPELIEPLQNAAYSNRLVATDKNVYTLGEQATIWINYRQDSFTLRIVTPTTVYRYLGSPGETITFQPSESGEYAVQFFDAGHLIEEKRFSVVSPELSEGMLEFIPQTNIAYKIRDHAEQKIPAKVTIRENGAVIQSNIDPTHQYDIEIIPATGGVTSIKLNGLKFSSVLDLGFEQVDPKLNLNVSGSLAAFAIDPSRLDFVNGTITVIPPEYADTLYKCVDYDFSSQRCNGKMTVIATFVPGTTLTIPFDRLDPLYSFYSNTINCSCSYRSGDTNSGDTSCSTFCGVTINAPGATAESGFITQMRYVVTLILTLNGTTASNPSYEGNFDHDSTVSNGNEINVGNNTNYVTNGQTSFTWTRSGMASSGSYSFNKLDCNNWPTTCSNYYVYLYGFFHYQATGKSTKSTMIQMSLTSLNATWNYTAYGNVIVTLNSPSTGSIKNSRMNIPFVFTPNTTEESFLWCSLYTNETSWSSKKNSTSITKNATNTIYYNATADGNYKWNIQCKDSSGQIKFGANNYTLLIDSTEPAVKLMLPIQNNTETGTVVTFQYNVSDALSAISNCSLYVNGVLKDVDTTVTKDEPQTFIEGISPNGYYSWYVTCYDAAGNYNSSVTRYFTMDAPSFIYNNTWYESYSANCAGTGACSIDLEQATDGTTNTRTMTVPGGSIVNLLNATSDYLGGNGVYIPSTATVSFSAYFSAKSGVGTLFLTWKLYAFRNNGTKTLICQFGADDGTGAVVASATPSSGSCIPSTGVFLSSSDRLFLVMNVANTHKTQAGTFTHDWDVANSYVHINPFQTLGTLAVDLVSPTTDQTIAQNEALPMTCQATCTKGYCLATSVYAQKNTSSSAWSSIGATGNLILNGSETNPHNLGNLLGSPASNSTNTTIVIKGNAVSVNNIRCIATSTYSNALGATTKQITIGDSTAPNINLTNPSDHAYTNNATVRLTYNVYDTSSIANCSLYINGTFNKTNSTPVTNPGTNQFTLLYANRASVDFNWTVKCYDIGGLLGNAGTTRYVHVDRWAPNITLNAPEPDVVFNYDTITFNYTPYDNRGDSLSCSLYIDSAQKGSAMSVTPGNWANKTVTNLSIGQHSWNVTCQDLAGNLNRSTTRYFNITDISPTVTLLSPSSNSYDADGNLVLNYNASDNNGFQKCDLYFNGLFNKTNSTPIVNNAQNSFTLNGVPEGNHSWTVNCTDTNGYTDQYAPVWKIIVDLNNPVVGLISPKNTQLASGSFNFQFQMNDTMSYNATCALKYNTSTFSTTLTDINAIRTLTTSKAVTNVGDGIYSWNVTCRDKANHFGSSTLAQFNVSQTPTVVLGTPAPNAYMNGALVNFTFTPTDNDGFRNCSVRLLTGPITGDYLNTSKITNGVLNWRTIAGLSSGSYTWSVRCYDNGTFLKSYQPAARFLFIDNVNPTLSLHSPVNEQVNFSYVTFNWTADDDQDLTLSCDLWIDANRNVTGIASSAGAVKNYTITGFTNGNHNWTLNCTDDAGNWNMSAWKSFTVAVPPIVYLSSPANNAFFNYYRNMNFTYVPNSTGTIANCSLYIDNVFKTVNTSTIINGASNSFIVNFTSSFEGNHTWNVSCTDTMGITGSSPTNRAFTIDLYQPTIARTHPQNDDTESWNNVTFNFTVVDSYSPNTTCNLTVSGANELTNVIIENNTPYVVGILYSDFNYNWTVTCRDLAGNINTTSLWNFTVYAPPTVTLSSPADYSLLNTSSVTVTYLPRDAYPIPVCNLTFDGKFNQTDNTINTNNYNTFVIPDIADGLHNWTVECRDTDTNVYAPSVFHFRVDTHPPSITLHNPAPATIFTTTPNVTFNFTANDAMVTNVTCNLTVDNVNRGINLAIVNALPYAYVVNNFGDALHQWNVTCQDDARNKNTSARWNFTTNIAPSVSLFTPADDVWSRNTSITYQFTVADNDGFSNCSVYLNGSRNVVKSSITNNALNFIVNASMREGFFNWTVNCTDSGAFHNTHAPTARLLKLDRSGPNILLENPPNGNLTHNSTVTFNFTPDDTWSLNVTCNLTIDTKVNKTYTAVTAGDTISETITDFTPGIHWWYVRCIDMAGNLNTSLTFNFTVPQPDMVITADNITLSDAEPVENQTLTVFATIYNIGSSTASSFKVQFFRGDPDAGGVQIGTNRTITNLGIGQNRTVNVSYTPIIGTNDLYVIVDPPLATNGTISEINEMNNKAYTTVIVGFYTIFSGETVNALHVANAALAPVWAWNISNATGGNILIADSDSSFNFLTLHALGLDTANATQFDDFSDLDVELSAASYADNINATWTSGNAARQLRDYMIFNKLITDVPVVNSTNSSAFQTGILWDTSDGGAEYDGTQDVIFLTQINESKAGYSGVYDYEVKIPAPLRSYTGATNSVVFYTELT